MTLFVDGQSYGLYNKTVENSSFSMKIGAGGSGVALPKKPKDFFGSLNSTAE